MKQITAVISIFLDQKESQIRYLIRWKMDFLNMKKCLCQILISSRRLYWILQWFFPCLLGKLRTLFPIEITNDNVVFLHPFEISSRLLKLLRFHNNFAISLCSKLSLKKEKHVFYHFFFWNSAMIYFVKTKLIKNFL